MLVLILICLVALLLNLVLQLGAIALGIRISMPLKHADSPTLLEGIRILGVLVTVLFFGHLFQIAVWATLFLGVGAIDDFATAFYHSTVNYSSLGYGDVVMEHPWRLAGALEACTGVMMFGVSTATLFAALSHLLRARHGITERGKV
ncbi:ion transport 2 domain-containing protein [Haloferula helveola]|uniref:Ion transport 2 domain-containing protein n=1 Tax=Haloferula helveola TaxID=490095 RepID=A0ABM7RAE3_9BACT|nr:ion transport 2 domain-containing protein [Haloferula helveola]